MKSKSVVIYKPLDLRIEDAELPGLKSTEALVKIRASGICGSDVNCYAGKTYEATFPYVPGHEWSGDVVEVGNQVKSLKKGDRVVGETVVGCGYCDKCKLGINPNFCRTPIIYGFQTQSPGGFSQYVIRSENILHKIPDEMTHEQGALVEPLSVAYHALWKIAGGVQGSDTVVIFGAGPIGLLVLATVKATGARAISIDPIAKRRELALQLGANEVIDPTKVDATQEMQRLTGGRGADLAVEASGSDDARTRLLDVVDSSSRIVMIGQTVIKKLPFEMEKIIVKGLTIKGSAGSPNVFPQTIDLLSKKKADISKIISHTYPLEKAKEAFDLATQRSDSIKIVLTI
ncbi:MAG: alcohol dehydrogenase catalytic domain-containing protein [Thaumarchaeota archaeon]|nr:alcohol dehydrogenase catalytic domain-containing protein [Nitrososphaerota archaeon]